MPLYQLVYRSIPSVEMTWPVLSSIIANAQSNNTRDHITGLLVWFDGYFLQALEGPRLKLNKCYQRIAIDDRHTDVELMTMRPIPRRLFPDWRMRALNYLGLSSEEKDSLRVKYTPDSDELRVPDDETLCIALMLDALHLCRMKDSQDTKIITPAEKGEI